MKKKFKILSLMISACMAFGLAAIASGCSENNKIGTWFDQILCSHEYDDGNVTEEATCTEKGTWTYTCLACGKEKTEVIAPLGHTAVTDAAVAATCMTDGKTEGSHCSVCNEVITAQETIPAKGHTEVTDAAVAATCTTSGKTAGKHCSVCNEVITAQEIIPATGHMDSNGDLSCDTCGIKALNEVTPTVGECVAGKTYRIYPAKGYSGETVYAYQPELYVTVTLTDGTTKTLCVTVCGEMFSSVNQSGFVFEDTLGDGYRDVTFKVGTYTALDANGNEFTFTIDETSIIDSVKTSESGGETVGYVRRLESTSIANEES